MNVKAPGAVLLGICIVATPVPARPQAAQVVGVHYLKVRASPDFLAAETGVLAAGDVVDVLDSVGRWAYVELKDGSRGYVSRKYLVAPLTGDIAEPASTVLVQAPADATREGPQTSPTPPAASATMAAPAGAPQPGPAAVRPRRNLLCTKADLEMLREDLQDLATGQDRLAALATRTDTASGGGASAPLSRWRTLVWIAVGFAIGLVAGRAIGRRDRWRRHRVRI